MVAPGFQGSIVSMRTPCIPLLLLLLSGFVAGPLRAYDPADGFHRLPLDGALSQNTVTAMLQDRRGQMWFGTLGGVDVYDGYRFRSLSSDPRDPQGLAGVQIADLLEDRDGRIWVAGMGGWLDRVDASSGEITHVSAALAAPPDRPGSNALVLHEDAAGDIWIGSNRGLHRWSRAQEALQLNADTANGRDSVLSAVTAIAGAADGSLWIGTPAGLARYRPQTGEVEWFRHEPADPRSLGDDRIVSLLLDAAGRLWVGTVGGISRLDREPAGFTRFRADPQDPGALAGGFVRALLQDSHGRIWAGTQSGGLNLHVDGAFRRFVNDPDDPASLGGDDIWSLFEDDSGLIWIGTAGAGLNQINPSTRRFQGLRSLPFNTRSLRSPFVWDVAEDAAGRIWLTTLAGLERFDPRDGSLALFEPRPGDKPMNQLQALHIDGDDRIWVGAVNGHLYRFDPADASFAAIAAPGSSRAAFSIDRVWYLGGEPGGPVWIGVGEGVFALDPATGAVAGLIGSDARTPMGAQPVRSALTDSDGVVWFGGGGAGLIRFDPGRGVTAVLGHDPRTPGSLSDNGVRALHEGPDGTLWVGTHNGLNRLSAEDRRSGRNRFRLYTQADGLPNNTVYGILPEGDGRHLWLSTNAGLARFDTEQATFHTYTVADGLTANEMNGGAELRSQDGRLYFGSVGGLTWFDPAGFPMNTHAPRVAITGIERHGGTASHTRIEPGVPLRLAHDATAFTLDFAVMDFHQPQKNRFRYRLLGPGGGDWVQTAQPSVSFAALPPGTHGFEVYGANNDGFWSEQPARLDIVVTPPWWRTPLAHAGQLLLVLLVGFAYHRAQRAKLVRQRAVNEEIGRAWSLAEAGQQLAQRHALFDQLTQLPNRLSLIDVLGRWLRSAREDGQPLALLLINLDRFQQINDSIGHALGDRVLQITAERVQRIAGAERYLARVGSDEFALIARPAAGDSGDDWPEQLAARLQQAIAEPHALREPPLIVGASIGIACHGPEVESPSDLLGHADIAMHNGKRHARGSVMRYRTGMRESVRERLSIEGRMRRALEANEFVAHYQPLVEVVGGRLSGFEALIRWLPPDSAPIYPDQFIPVAEESGLIVDLGNWMLREVCRQLAEWRAAGVGGISVAVNVSMRQLRTGALPAHLSASLSEFRVPPSMIKIEITESAMMENVEDTAEQLAAIRRLGVAVSVDDFGTGFSSLAHLKRLPVSELKIDRSFVADVATSEQSRKIVASIVRLAHELDLSTVGEGVEDAASLACLRAIGCDLAQGYHFARPMSAAQLWDAGWLQVPRRRRA